MTRLPSIKPRLGHVTFVLFYVMIVSLLVLFIPQLPKQELPQNSVSLFIPQLPEPELLPQDFGGGASYCIHSHSSPRYWFSTEKITSDVIREQLLYPPSRYEVLVGPCSEYCDRFCTNSTTYNSDHCAMPQYGDRTECCHKPDDDRPGLQFNDKCSPEDYCCPGQQSCVRDGLFDIHGACGIPCASSCDITGGCCKGWTCKVGNEVESGNGWCVILDT
jgi:hypothetical protein